MRYIKTNEKEKIEREKKERVRRYLDYMERRHKGERKKK